MWKLKGHDVRNVFADGWRKTGTEKEGEQEAGSVHKHERQNVISIKGAKGH